METPDIGTGVKLDNPSVGSTDGWTFDGTSGLIDRDWIGFGNPAPQFVINSFRGDQVAYLDGPNASIERELTLPSAGIWRIRYRFAPRPAATEDHKATIEVFFGGQLVDRRTTKKKRMFEFATLPIEVEPGNLTQTVRFQHATMGLPYEMALIDMIKVERVLEWGDPSTWEEADGSPANRLPNSDDDVEIADGSTVAISGTLAAETIQCHGRLTAVTNQAEATHLSTKWLLVRTASNATAPLRRGTLEVGRDGIPFLGDFTLELTASRTDEKILAMGTKFLAAMDRGGIELHGKPKTSWTHLAASALGDSTSFRVENASGWSAGDQVAITSSVFQHRASSEHQGPSDPDVGSKVFTLAVDPSSVSTVPNNGGAERLLEMVAPATNPQSFFLGRRAALGQDSGEVLLTALDPATSLPLAGIPQSLDQTAEVANLTRNVRVVGDASSPADLNIVPMEQNFGGHVMIMKSPGSLKAGGTGRFSNVEFTNMGQDTPAGLGRYPIHFHMLKDEGHGQFVRGCSIHDTFNRAITIHGTDGVDVSDNVAYNNQGHAIFLEDGSEQFNVIHHNLVMDAKRPMSGREVIGSDNSGDRFNAQSPASYWITNPHNVITDNVAAGSVGTGFWVIPVRKVMGLSDLDPELSARQRPIRQQFMVDAQGRSLFKGNRAHGVRIGLHLNNSVAQLDETGPFVPGDGYTDAPHYDTAGVLPNCSWLPSTRTGDDTDPWSDDEQAVVLDFVAYGCLAGIYASTGGDRVKYRGFIAADCNRAIDLAAYHTLEDSVIAQRGHLEEKIAPVNGSPPTAAAFQTYDGAARYVNVAVHGFHSSRSGLTKIRGSATMHPNQFLQGVHYFFDNTSSVQSIGTPWRPIVELGRLASAGANTVPLPNISTVLEGSTTVYVIGDPLGSGTQGSTIFSGPGGPYAPSHWGAVLLDEDHILSHDPLSPSSVGDSIVTAHPWMFMEASGEPGFAYRRNSGPPNKRAYVVPYRFGQVRLSYFGDQSPPLREANPRANVDDVEITCYPGPMSARRARRFSHKFHGRKHKQIPVAIDGPSSEGMSEWVYRLDHTAANFTAVNQRLEIEVDDTRIGDQLVIELHDFRQATPSDLTLRLGDDQLETPPPGTSVAAALGLSRPQLVFESGPSGLSRVLIVVNVDLPGTTIPNAQSEPAGTPNHNRIELTDDPVDKVHTGSVNRSVSEWRREVLTLEWTPGIYE